MSYVVKDAAGQEITGQAVMTASTDDERAPVIGNSGWGVRFDGTDDHLGSSDFALEHKTWMPNADIYGTFNDSEVLGDDQ